MREGLELARATGVHTWSFQLLAYGYGGALARQDLEEAAGIARPLGAPLGGGGRLGPCRVPHFQGGGGALGHEPVGGAPLAESPARRGVGARRPCLAGP